MIRVAIITVDHPGASGSADPSLEQKLNVIITRTCGMTAIAIAKKAKVQDFHPYRFRRTFATRLLSGGMVLEPVQNLCGWRSIESPMR